MSPPNLSLVVVMVCFWVTFWLVQKFLITPLGATIAERQQRVDGAAEAWQSKHEEYLSATSRLESEMEEAAREAAKLRSERRQEALQGREERLRAARQEADGRLTDALGELEADATAAREELRRRAQELAKVFASQLLGREV